LKLASRNLRLVSCASIGRDEEHLLLTVEDVAGSTQKVLWWHGAGWPLPNGRFDLAYSVRAVTFRGQREVQIEWLDHRPVSLLEGSISQPESIHLVDYRQVPHPLAVLKQVLSQELVQVWAEGDAARKLTTESVHAVNRQELQPGPTLAIWTAPPGRKELQEALDKVKPARVLLFALHPESEQLGDFLNRLAGMAKHATNHQEGFLNLEKVASATAQTVPAVRKGIDWLASRGLFQIVLVESGTVQLKMGSSESNPAELSRLSRELKELLEEARAFRDYLSRVPELKL
jgi:single-stranded-DNA-specific exonuclease